MRIHHATATKAEKLGITMGTDEKYGFWAEVPKSKSRNNRFYAAKAPEALAAAELEKMLRAEYPAISFFTDDGYCFDHVETEGPFLITETLPSLSDLLEACEAEGLDPEQGLEDEQPEVVVVKAKYKVEYAARGNPDNCGDELAQLLDGMFVTQKGEDPEAFDWQVFESFLVLNGVDISGKWATLPSTGSRGWQGRYRMNGRQKLEQVIAERGTVILLDKREIKMSAETIETFRERHSRVLEKRAKAREVTE